MRAAGRGIFQSRATNDERKSMKKTSKKNIKQNVAVEIPLRDGSVSLLVGELQSRTKDAIILDKAAFVKDTGRRSEFFAGRFDSNSEFEPYPDGMVVELPASGAQIYSWPHGLLRTVK
jgi:hypothetical protein